MVRIVNWWSDDSVHWVFYFILVATGIACCITKGYTLGVAGAQTLNVCGSSSPSYSTPYFFASSFPLCCSHTLISLSPFLLTSLPYLPNTHLSSIPLLHFISLLLAPPSSPSFFFSYPPSSSFPPSLLPPLSPPLLRPLSPPLLPFLLPYFFPSLLNPPSLLFLLPSSFLPPSLLSPLPPPRGSWGCSWSVCQGGPLMGSNCRGRWWEGCWP